MTATTALASLFFTPKQFAELTNVPYRTVLDLLGRGEIEHERFGRHYRIPRRVLAAYSGSASEGEPAEPLRVVRATG